MYFLLSVCWSLVNKLEAMFGRAFLHQACPAWLLGCGCRVEAKFQIPNAKWSRWFVYCLLCFMFIYFLIIVFLYLHVFINLLGASGAIHGGTQ